MTKKIVLVIFTVSLKLSALMGQTDKYQINWHDGAFNVNVIDSNDGIPDSTSVFTWKTMVLNFTSTITGFEPPHRLSRESEKRSIQGYHAWLIIPTDKGCRVITDESQPGLLTF